MAIVLFSSMITLVLTAAQLFLDYQRDISGIDSRLQQVRDVHLDSVANGLWALDEHEAQVLINGILQLPDLVYLEIQDQKQVWITGGEIPEGDLVEALFRLYEPGAAATEASSIGSFRVVASLQQVYQRLFDQAVTLLISNAIKTFLVAGFILLLVNRLITRHLHALSGFMLEHDIDDTAPLDLDRHMPLNPGRDELDLLVDGFNSMRSELRSSFEDLRQAERQYRALYDNMAQGVIYQDRDGEIISVNQAGCEILDMSRRELIGQKGIDPGAMAIRENGDPFPPEELPATIALREARIVHNAIMGIQHEGKSEFRWVLISARPEFLPGEEQPCRVFSTFTDITERKRIERERELLIRELEAKNKRLERFAYTVSHELKSPLVTIAGFTGMLRRDQVNGNVEKADSDLGQIERATQTMSMLLEDLLKLARVGHEENSPELVSLGDLAREASAHLPFRKGGAAEIEIAADMPMVMADRSRLLEVMQNLIENAAKFSKDNPHPKIVVSAETDGNMAICCVQDNGCGIDQEYHERIFNLFERLDLGVEGTGMGLALTRGIVESHGGKIWVESDGAGNGSRFFFSVPRPLEAAAVAS